MGSPGAGEVPAAADASPTVRPGNRVQLGADRGYVRYTGEVAGHAGQRVGIDWDSPARGKHDGTVGGTRYFTASSPTSGSFVRAHKLGDGGRVSLQEAICRRGEVGPEDAHDPGWIQMKASEPARDAAGVADAPALDLSGLGVHGFADQAYILDDTATGVRAASVRSLRIAESLLSDWLTVVRMLVAFPALRHLDASRNRFDHPLPANRPEETEAADEDAECPGNVWLDVFAQLPEDVRLEELVLNGTNARIADVLSLCAACSRLNTLRLFGGGLTTLQPCGVDTGAALACVRVVDLGGNRVPWKQMQAALGRLQALAELFLRDAGIGSDSEQVAPGNFPVLERLSVSANPIADWTFVSSLALLPSLTSLLIADTPLTADEADWDPVSGADAPEDGRIASRHGIMARLAKLRKLHGSVINADERVYAEKRYLAVECIPALKEFGKEEAERRHPRMRELCGEYDVDLDEAAKGALVSGVLRQGKTLRADMVKVTFRREGKGDEARMLPRCVSVAKLRVMGAKFLKMGKRRGLVWRITHKGTESVFGNESSTLSEMHVMPGEDVIIAIADEEAKKREGDEDADIGQPQP